MPDDDLLPSDGSTAERDAVVDKIAAGTATEQDLRRYVEIRLEGYDVHASSDGAWNVAFASATLDELAGAVASGQAQQTFATFLEHLNDLGSGQTAVSRTPPKQNQTRVVDPVEAISGEFVHEATDLQLSGAGMDFAFRRTYRSLAVSAGPLGVGWDHAYNMRLRDDGPQLVVSIGDGRTETYTRHPRFGEAERFTYFLPPDGVHAVLLVETGSFVRRSPDGIRHVFDPVPSRPRGYRLARIVDRFDNLLRLQYDDQDDRLLSVSVNGGSREVKLSYEGCGLLQSVEDHAGRIWRYRYDQRSNLAAVIDPLGATTAYEYDTDGAGAAVHRLTRVVDAECRWQVENEYGPRGRIVRQLQGGGVTTFEYDDVVPLLEGNYTPSERPTRSVRMIDGAGQVVESVFNIDGQLLERAEHVVQGGLPARLVWRYRYNADGAVVASLSPEGVLVQRLYGREQIQRQLGDGTDADLSADLAMLDRLGFGRILATVRRGDYHPYAALALAGGAWGDIFPSIFGVNDSVDAVEKISYEPTYGQVLTQSDPLFTRNPDPDTPIDQEHPRFDEALVRFEYEGPQGDATRQLAAIHRPSPGRPGQHVSERFTAYDDAGRLLRHVDPTGTVTDLTYHGPETGPRSGHLRSSTVDPHGLALHTEYDVDALGRVVAVKAPGGSVTTMEFDDLDRAVLVTSAPPFGYTTRRTFDRTGALAREERDRFDESGQALRDGVQVRTFCYDAALHLLTESLGGVDRRRHRLTRHCYDARGLRTVTLWPGGSRTRLGYDERGLLTSTTTALGTPDQSVVRTGYDGDGRPTTATSARGFVTRTTLDPLGRAVELVTAQGTTTRRLIDKAGNVLVERVFGTSPDGQRELVARTEYEFDVLGRQVRLSANLFDSPVAVADVESDFLDVGPPGRLLSTVTEHDEAGRIVARTDPLGRRRHIDRDPLGRSAVEVDPLGNSVVYHYDPDGNVVRRDVHEAGDPSERVFPSVWEFDTLGRCVVATDSLGNETRCGYDSLDNRTRVTDPLGNVLRAEFDVFGQRVQTMAELRDTGLGPGALLPPAKTSFEYDADSRLQAVVDPLSRRTQYDYDAAGRQVSTTYPDGARSTTAYDEDGNAVKFVDPDGRERSMTYDPTGRLVRVDVAGPASGPTFVDFVYDALGREVRAENDHIRVETTRDSFGHPVVETTTVDAVPGAWTLGRNFDDAGQISEFQFPAGRRIRISRDAFGHLVGMDNVALGSDYPGDASAPTPIATLVRAGGRLERLESRDGGYACRFDYDGLGRPLGITHELRGQPILALQSLHDAAGNLRVNVEEGPGGVTAQTYRYDSLYRLVEVAPSAQVLFDPGPFAPASTATTDPIPRRQDTIDATIGPLGLTGAGVAYDHDLTGNRTVEHTRQGDVIDYDVNVRDQYERRADVHLDHDRAGLLRQDGRFTYEYDAWGRLLAVKRAFDDVELVRYHRDPSGRPVVELREGRTTVLVHDGERVIAEHRDDVAVAQYLHVLPGVVHVATGSADYLCGIDRMSSVRLLVDTSDARVAARYSYDPYGLPTTPDEGPRNPWRYVGARREPATGHYELGSRSYSPELGRFLQPDPAGMADGTNQYSYVGNNPLTHVDRSGLTRERHDAPIDWDSVRDTVGEWVNAAGAVADTVGAVADGLAVHRGLEILGQLANDSPAFFAKGAPQRTALLAAQQHDALRLHPSGSVRELQGGLERLANTSAFTKAARLLDVGAVVLGAWQMYKDPSIQNAADLGADVIGLGGTIAGMFGTGSVATFAAPLMGAFSAGYGGAKAAMWAVDSVASWMGYEVDPVGILMDRTVKSEFLVDAIGDAFMRRDTPPQIRNWYKASRPSARDVFAARYGTLNKSTAKPGPKLIPRGPNEYWVVSPLASPSRDPIVRPLIEPVVTPLNPSGARPGSQTHDPQQQVQQRGPSVPELAF